MPPVPYPRISTVTPAKAGGSIGKIYDLEIELPDYQKRSYTRSTPEKRNKKGQKAARNTTSSAKQSRGRQAGDQKKGKVIKTEIKTKQARRKPAEREPKPESARQIQKRLREEAEKQQLSLF